MVLNTCHSFYPRPTPSGKGVVAWSKILAAIIAVIVIWSPDLMAEDHRLGAVVSVIPQQYFLRHIGGELIDIQVMVPPGASPHTYEPKPRQMRDIARARIYFAVGVPFEKAWLPKISATNPQMKIIQTDLGIAKISMDVDHAHDRTGSSNGPGAGIDPHIWLSPPLVRIMAGHILNALVLMDPDHQDDYRRNYQQFSEQTKALDAELHQMLAPLKGARFLVFHPSWGYFAQAYNLVQIPIEFQGKAPKPSRLRHLIESARRLGIKAVIVQPQFSQKSAGVIADAIDGRIVTADPMAQNWDESLRNLARQLRTIAR